MSRSRKGLPARNRPRRKRPPKRHGTTPKRLIEIVCRCGENFVFTRRQCGGLISAGSFSCPFCGEDWLATV